MALPVPELSETDGQGLGTWLNRGFNVLIAAGVIAIVVFGFWGVLDNRDDALDTATDVMAEWNAALVIPGGIDAAELFTKDAIYIGPDDVVYRGRDDIWAHRNSIYPQVTDAKRLGEGVATEDGFVFEVQMEVNGRVIEGDVAIQLDGDRASRMEWLRWTEVSL